MTSVWIVLFDETAEDDDDFLDTEIVDVFSNPLSADARAAEYAQERADGTIPELTEEGWLVPYGLVSIMEKEVRD